MEAVLRLETKRVKAVAAHPNWPTTPQLAATTHEGEVMVVDVESGKVLVQRNVLEGHSEELKTRAVRAVAWCTTGIVVGTDGGDVHMLQADDLAVMHSASSSDGQPAHRDFVRSIAVAVDGTTTLLCSSGDDMVARVWTYTSADGFRLLHCSPAHPHYVMAAAFAPASNEASWTVATACLDGRVRTWRSDDVAELKHATLHDAGVNHVRFSDGGSTLTSASDDGTIRRWDVAKDTCVAVLRGHAHNVSAVDVAAASAVASKSITTVSASEDGTLRWWDVQRQCEVAARSDVGTDSSSKHVWRFGQQQHLKREWPTERVMAWAAEHVPELPNSAAAFMRDNNFDGAAAASLAHSGATAEQMAANTGLPADVARAAVAVASAFVESQQGAASKEEEGDDTAAETGEAAEPVDATSSPVGDAVWGRAWTVCLLPSTPRFASASSLCAAVGTDRGLLLFPTPPAASVPHKSADIDAAPAALADKEADAAAAAAMSRL